MQILVPWFDHMVVLCSKALEAKEKPLGFSSCATPGLISCHNRFMSRQIKHCFRIICSSCRELLCWISSLNPSIL